MQINSFSNVTVTDLARVSCEEVYGEEQFTPEIRAELNAFYDEMDRKQQ